MLQHARKLAVCVNLAAKIAEHLNNKNLFRMLYMVYTEITYS